jgi:hypothetical protein
LALVLASLVVSTTLAQTGAPLPAPAKTDGVKPASLSKDDGVKPAVIGKDEKAKPAFSDRDTGVHQMVVVSGPTRNVHYFARSGSPSEEAALRKLEQAENELALQESLQGLRQQYVNTESLMESRRRVVQQRMYGLNITSKTVNQTTYPLVGQGEPSPYGTPFATGFFNGGSFFPMGGLGYGGGMGYGTTQRSEYDVNQSLANGIGDEGRFKTAMVAEMAKQSTPESISAAIRNYETALANAVGVRGSRVVGVTFEKMTPQRVTVTTSGGEKVSGELIRQDNDWIVVRTADSEERIRMADVSRVKMEIKK